MSLTRQSINIFHWRRSIVGWEATSQLAGDSATSSRGGSKLYDQFHLNEPWDSTHNVAALQNAIGVSHTWLATN